MFGIELADQVRPVAMRAGQTVNEHHGRALATVQIPELVTAQDGRVFTPYLHGPP